MSHRAKNLFLAVLERIMDGPRCRHCGHDTAIHGEGGNCLGAIHDRGVHVGWCPCTGSPQKGEDQ